MTASFVRGLWICGMAALCTASWIWAAQGPQAPPRTAAPLGYEGAEEGPDLRDKLPSWTPEDLIQEQTAKAGPQYVIVGWNDLGMHCISSRFADMAILPPFNNLCVQVIQRGDPPSIVTSGVSLEYSIKNNTHVAGKTDFWQHAQALFNVQLAPGMGLAGKGLSGTLDLAASGDVYEAVGIPVLPLNDQMRWNPYQTAVVKLKNSDGKVLKTINVVLPVSDEMRCDKCHGDRARADPNIATGSVERNILTLHDQEYGTTLMDARPVLCASCHADAALNLPGDGQRHSLSYAMHTRHAALTAQPSCYDCHPGSKTRCNRSAIEDMGPHGSDPNCQKCHGNLIGMSNGLKQGRQPWLEEPTCVQCHDRTYATNEPLYRHSVGHGGVYCAACHNSPHAWWPSLRKADNAQPRALQHRSSAIGKCSICHTNKSIHGDDPHEAESEGEDSGPAPAGWLAPVKLRNASPPEPEPEPEPDADDNSQD